MIFVEKSRIKYKGSRKGLRKDKTIIRREIVIWIKLLMF